MAFLSEIDMKIQCFLHCQALCDYFSVNPWLITVIEMEAANMQIYNLYKTLTYLHTVMTDNVVIKILNIEILHWLKKYDLILDKKNLIPILILKKENRIKRIHYPINSS